MTQAAPAGSVPEAGATAAATDVAAATVRGDGRCAAPGNWWRNWLDAVAVLAVLAPLLVLAKHLRPVADATAWWIRIGDGQRMAHVPYGTWPRVALWGAVAVLALLGWRRSAALGAWVAVGAEVALWRVPYSGDALLPTTTVWATGFALAATLVLTLAAWVRPPVRFLGTRGLVLFGVAGLIAAASAAVTPFLWELNPPVVPGGPDPGFVPIATVRSQMPRIVVLSAMVLVGVLAAAAVIGTAAPVRRRALGLLAAGTTLVIALKVGGGFQDPAGPLTPDAGGILIRIIAPALAVLLIAAAAVHWWERHSRRSDRSRMLPAAIAGSVLDLPPPRAEPESGCSPADAVVAERDREPGGRMI